MVNLVPFAIIAAMISAGCQPTQLGQCDIDVATTLVFDRQGNPAYAGQAMVQESCSSCHGAGSEGIARRGAPAELDFDMIGLRDAASDGAPVAFGSETPDQSATLDRLGSARQTIFDWRFAMYDTVVTGTMPPGDLGETAYVSQAYTFADGRPLPRIESSDGQEIYREWLACNGPVVERTGPSSGSPGATCPQSDGSTVGDCVYQGEGQQREIPPIWSAIQDQVLTPEGCLATGCHSAVSPAADLSLVGPVSSAMVGVMPSAGGMCDGEKPRVVAGDPGGSLLFDKLARAPGAAACSAYIAPTTTCGTQMPLAGFVGCDALEAVRGWIEAGALDN